jgi:hypothetical protein
MLDQDTPPREAGSISGAVGVVRKDAAGVRAVPAVEECRASARSNRESLPLPWITVTALP